MPNSYNTTCDANHEVRERESILSLLAERAKQWEAEWLLQGIDQGVSQGLAQERELLRSLANQKFDPATAESLALRLATVADPACLNEIGCWIIDTSTGAELLDKTDRKLGYSPIQQPEPFSIMNSTTRAFGDLIRFDRERQAMVEMLPRIPLGASPDQGGIDEKSLQHLLFRAPEALPIAAIDSAYDGAVPICRELRTRAGPLDALYVNPLGRLTIVEFKLWRNPQARREVIGQILDYARELASWSYEDLQRAVSVVLNRKGNVLYETVRAASGSELNEADFVDDVTRYLSRGEFLLLIVGDGIREGAENIVDFVQRHSGLHFNLALVEAALFQDGASRIIVQPRVLARTEIVQRFVVEGQIATEQENAKDDADEDSLSDWQQENLRFWKAVLDDFTFSDVTVDTPSPTKESAIYVRVQQPGIGFTGLSFVGYVLRKRPHVGCYLSYRANVPQAASIHKRFEESLEALKHQMGNDLDFWHNDAGRPRIGFTRPTSLPFVDDSPSGEFEEAVTWMRDRLDRLVSTLNPRLKNMLSSGS